MAVCHFYLQQVLTENTVSLDFAVGSHPGHCVRKGNILSIHDLATVGQKKGMAYPWQQKNTHTMCTNVLSKRLNSEENFAHWSLSEGLGRISEL